MRAAGCWVLCTALACAGSAKPTTHPDHVEKPEEEVEASPTPLQTPTPTAQWAPEVPPKAPGLDAFRALDTPLQTTTDPEACAQITAIDIEKGRRRLVATCDSGERYEFPVGLGRLALGEKRETGDLHTPEGQYRVAEPPRSSPYHIFMLLDYPSREDAERALLDGRISQETYARVVAAHERGDVPPQDTELGGRIGIHGEGEEHQGDSAHKDWTFGCVALSDAAVEFLAFRTPVGTPVQIHP
jgi:hypothetical protein